jgi:hypothetical protein
MEIEIRSGRPSGRTELMASVSIGANCRCPMLNRGVSEFVDE